jgi:hypothetical protein
MALIAGVGRNPAPVIVTVISSVPDNVCDGISLERVCEELVRFRHGWSRVVSKRAHAGDEKRETDAE